MKHYVLADGRQIRQCTPEGMVWQLLTLNGEHICYLHVEAVDYSRGLR